MTQEVPYQVGYVQSNGSYYIPGDGNPGYLQALATKDPTIFQEFSQDFVPLATLPLLVIKVVLTVLKELGTEFALNIGTHELVVPTKWWRLGKKGLKSTKVEDCHAKCDR